MIQKTKTCSYCGAVCDTSDVSCPQCLRAFAKDSVHDVPVIDGIDNNKLKDFIGKNSNYYLSKFKKAGDKKHFFQLNFPSLLFGQHWFFYRKMYKVAIMFTVMSILLTLVLNVCLAGIFNNTVSEYFSNKEAYIAYNKKDVDMLITNEEGYIVDNPDYDHSYSQNLKKSQDKIRTINFFMEFPVFAFSVCFRLLGNYFYKKHISQNIDNKDKGGTSKLAVFISLVVFSAISSLASVILFNIPIVSDFYEAYNSLYGWL